MDLWVRSQDKKSLVKVDNLYISVGNYICYYVEKGKEVPNTYYRPSGELGRYESEERALEVLDEIQSLLMPKLILNSYDNITPEFSQNLTIMPISTDIKQFNSYVYEMPEE